MAERDPVLGNEGGGGEAISLLPEDPPSSGEDAFDHVPLLDGGSMERGGGAVDVDRPGSSSFRQRSMHLNSPFSVEADANGSDHHRSVPLDSDNCCGGGMIHSASRAKLEADGRFVSGTFTAGDVARTLLFILIWYTFSTCLTLYNKELLGDKLGKFPAPLLMNTVHFTLQAVLSKIVLWFQTRKLDGKVIMTWKDYLLTVVPTALGTALDINLSNASLVFISVTFATMCKSASPIFLLVFAFAFRLESPSIKLFGIIFIISFGVLLTVAKETEFDFWGFIFVMLAAVMSGFRWCMTQILLQKDTYGLKNPITLMSYVAPVMALSSFILSLIMDPWHEFDSNTYFNSSWHVIRSCILMAIGGTLAFFMVLTEYILVSATSAVTVTIAGVVKEAVTIVVAVLYFHDQFTWLKATGLVIILVGVSLFNWYKYQKMNKAHHSDSEGAASMKYSILDKIDPQEDNI